MRTDYSNKNFQKAFFNDENLAYTDFSGCDLRGANFTGSNLTGADLTFVRTGITPKNVVLLFLAALVLSAISGYIAMLAGRTIQGMIASTDINIRNAGIIAAILIMLYILYFMWKGGGRALRNLLVPASVIALLVGLAGYLTGISSGMGMVYLGLSIFLVAIMFITGTIARAAAGTLSSTILFILVALAGSIFGNSVGGSIGTIIMAIACAIISNRALGGAKGFEALRKVAYFITRRFGTSFRNTKLMHVNFSHSQINNADFTNADVSFANWSDSRKINCIPGEIISLSFPLNSSL